VNYRHPIIVPILSFLHPS